MDKKVVSFCIPSFNRGERIYKLVTNILKYNGSDIDVVVLDNCSEDNTITLLNEITDDRFRLIQNQHNVGGIINILKALASGNSEYSFLCLDKDFVDSVILYSSTNKVYGDFESFHFKEEKTRYICNEYPLGFPESISLDFHSPYGCSKGSADQYLLDFHRIYGLKTIVFRHSSMYGTNQHATYDQGWIGWFCQKALEIKNAKLKEPFTISGTGKQVRDVLHGEDVTSLYFKAKDIDKVHGQVFNIGGGIENSLSLLELFSMLENSLGIKMQYTQIPWRESDQKVFVADIKKAREMLDWTPAISKENGIEKMLTWLQK
ncbi:GDP-mannose 4,6-dehydratase [Viscerimonas tarda]